MTTPMDFSTKPKHLEDRRRERESFYAQDPSSLLPQVITGMKMEHRQFGIYTTGCIPDGLTAYTRECGELVPCTEILFIWRDKKHFPITQGYIDNALKPKSGPMT